MFITAKGRAKLGGFWNCCLLAGQLRKGLACWLNPRLDEIT